MKTTKIKPRNGIIEFNYKEVWEYRQLLLSLAWRDIKVRYVQSILGFSWLVIKPLLSLAVLAFIFNQVIRVGTDGVPPLLFTASGVVVWSFFSSIIDDSSNSILNAQEMVKKIYFPRIVLPASKALSSLPEFVASILILLFLLLYFDIEWTPSILWFPLFILLIMLLGSGLGILISSLTIRYRDLKFVVPFFLRIGLYISPIAYSSNLIPDKYSFLLYLNPIVGIVDGIRWSLFGVTYDFSHIWFCCISIPLIFLASNFIFFKNEHTIADII
ncbi:ABC transporter permease [Portibacter marinus]|uniref:ABC transporter permease n=1 Tax=Portibacter marinus TaxID=2898660 RepID=UPI001F33BA2D|nr:ABC transporter permease [Portibacter marinus]